jgi:hypothetical protein
MVFYAAARPGPPPRALQSKCAHHARITKGGALGFLLWRQIAWGSLISKWNFIPYGGMKRQKTNGTALGTAQQAGNARQRSGRRG